MPLEAAAAGVIDFGQVSADTKAYFKSVEARMDQQFWESDDELYSFLSNVYGEVVGKELSLATDSDCSIVLEKLLHISTDTHLRVFMDKLSGKYVFYFYIPP
ncbi:hypothetical protein BCR44DRAFT_57756 [Catenaria anguillulae PL171]|uniref:Nucleolar protein 9 n=1 Tax=Catenaria anguillulae PL171 TaxID=765915 RepID=A0A1Y2HE59_9FUNG|nr:hypothetical protein BCR44DRAFT_57756 [Catenaria anguillulae PL171]